MSRLLYIDCVSGVAGDMLLAALLDAGADIERVREGLRSLSLDGLEVEQAYASRNGIRAAQVKIVAQPDRASRSWREMRELIERAALPDRARLWAEEAFRRLAEAEGRVHGVELEQVHFHELGTIDGRATASPRLWRRSPAPRCTC